MNFNHDCAWRVPAYAFVPVSAGLAHESEQRPLLIGCRDTRPYGNFAEDKERTTAADKEKAKKNERELERQRTKARIRELILSCSADCTFSSSTPAKLEQH